MHELNEPIQLSHGLNEVTTPYQEGLRVTLPDLSELESLPASGTITFRYTRESLHLPKDGKLSADICLCELLAVKGDKEEGEKDADVVDKLFKEAKTEPETEGKE